MQTDMNDKRIDELIERALREEQTLPEGLSQRLEASIDSWAKKEEKGKVVSFRRKLWYGISSAAAVVLLCVGLFFFQQNASRNVMADTYSDPEEAAVVAEKALLLLSQNLNRGIAEVNNAGDEIEKVNDILNKQLKD